MSTLLIIVRIVESNTDELWIQHQYYCGLWCNRLQHKFKQVWSCFPYYGVRNVNWAQWSSFSFLFAERLQAAIVLLQHNSKWLHRFYVIFMKSLWPAILVNVFIGCAVSWLSEQIEGYSSSGNGDTVPMTWARVTFNLKTCTSISSISDGAVYVCSRNPSSVACRDTTKNKWFYIVSVNIN